MGQWPNLIGSHQFRLQDNITNLENFRVSDITKTSAQCLATDWTAGQSRFDPRQRRKDFSSILCVQAGSGAHAASSTMGTRGPFPGAKVQTGLDAGHSRHLVPRSKMSRSYTSSNQNAFTMCSGTALALCFSNLCGRDEKLNITF
jgi:hypothetical protein